MSLRIGAGAEGRAARFLRSRGLKLRERNYRTRRGEIDLVMDDDGTLVFVEVRRRADLRYGGGAESIGARKRRRLTAAAAQYYQQLGRDCPCRFDVVAIDAEGEVDWIRNAFDAQ
ncbi:YraN family protein [Ectothiorhodospiraceae bacterium WFHF3C12]|nr:YraN family protein [Ectothiorhodospiraceae bacterium WFHF3C12]